MENVRKIWYVTIEFKGGRSKTLEVTKATQNHTEYFFRCVDGKDVTVPKYNVLYIVEENQVNGEENFHKSIDKYL